MIIISSDYTLLAQINTVIGAVKAATLSISSTTNIQIQTLEIDDTAQDSRVATRPTSIQSILETVSQLTSISSENSLQAEALHERSNHLDQAANELISVVDRLTICISIFQDNNYENNSYYFNYYLFISSFKSWTSQ